MPTILQLRRGTTAENAAYTGAAGEITVDTTLNKVLLHDGSTQGGAATVGNVQGNIQLGKTADGEIDTSSGNLTIDSAGGTVTVDDNLVVSGNLTVSGTTTTVDSTTVSIQNAFVFEGATDDAFETTLTTIDPTADRTISLPNVSGTIPVLAVASATQITSTPEELNILDGVTATASELNALDGITSSVSELNILDGVTATAAELNILDGVTATATELNLLDGITAIADEDDMSSDSATALATQQSIKAYVHSQVTAQDLDFQGDSGGALNIDLDSETLTIAGGTGIDTSGSGNTLTVAIDSTVATLTGTQTLTNKTLTSPTLTTPKIADDGAITDAAGNEQIIFQQTANAVNAVEVTNSATGNGVKIGSAGDDTNIDLILDPKGSGTVDVNNSRITNVTDPSSDQDAATKAYVDSVANGLDVKASVKYASTGNVSGTYNNAAGTITAGSNGAFSIDGATPSQNDRILLKDQSTATQNGLYRVTTVGDGSTAYVLTRTPDGDEAAEITGGAFVFVEAGTANADNGYVFTHNGTPTLGTTNITVEQFSGAGQISAGDALTKTGNQLDVAVDDSTIEVSSDALQIKTTYPGQTSITTLGTIATGTWQGTVIDEVYGGTGQSSYTTGDILYASGANTLAKLALGNNGKILQSNGSNVTYGDIDGGTF